MMADLLVSVPSTKSSSPSIFRVWLSKIHSDCSPLEVRETAMPRRPAASAAWWMTVTPGIRAAALTSAALTSGGAIDWRSRSPIVVKASWSGDCPVHAVCL
jgi:hypothetical protein